MKKNTPGEEQKNSLQKKLSEQSLFIIWKPEYNLGIPIIDEQHRGIVTTINTLYFGIKNDYADEFLAPIVNMMHEYSRIHFQVEETFLEIIDSVSAEKHRALHRELIATLSNTGKKSMLNKDAYQFVAFLKKWWVDHICNEDLIYRNHLGE